MKALARWRGSLGLAPIAILASVLYAAFLLWPLVYGVYTGFTDMSPLQTGQKFVGLHNYRTMVHDPEIPKTLVFSLLVTIAVTVISNALGLALAIFLNQPTRAFRAMRTIVFIPQVLSGIVVGFIWRGMFSPDGFINHMLLQLHLVKEPVSWIGTPHLATFVVIVIVSWGTTAFCAVVYTASLQSVPTELYEAAHLDGANAWRRFTQVTWPMIAPGTTICVVLCLITSFKLFDIIVVVTNGGPADATQTLASYFVKVGFTGNNFGYASAIATLLLVVVAVISYSATALLRRREAAL